MEDFKCWTEGFIKNNQGYDTDSSPQAWEFYQVVYQDYFKKRKIDFKNLEEENNRKFVIDPATSVKIGGDVVINVMNTFNHKNNWNKDLEENTKTKKRIEEYGKDDKKYAYCNLSLCPITGGLNNFKGFAGINDRLDIYLKKIKEFYCCDSEPKPNLSRGRIHENNKIALHEWLESFGNGEYGFYKYCNTIFFIEKEFVGELLDNAEKMPIITCDADANRYLDFVYRFWEMRNNRIEKIIRSKRK